MTRRAGQGGLLLAGLGAAVFVALVPALYSRSRPLLAPEMEVAMPRFVQVLLAAGDRYLAANAAVFRALVATTETMSAENYRIQGVVQSDAAWLNPAHEDNYYIATAILPWAGEVAATQYILRLATDARPFDVGPPFFYGFNELHFQKDAAAGARWLLVASRHTRDTMEQIQLQQMAAQWVSKGEDREFSIRLHRTMANQTSHKAFARFLEKRANRLENLLLLDRALFAYRERFGKVANRLQQLVDSSIIKVIPPDPFGMSYAIDAQGKAEIVQAGATASGGGQ